MNTKHRKRAYLGERERIVVIGNCQAEVVAHSLGHPAFERYFETRYHFVDLPESAYDRGRSDLARCTVLLVQDISNFDAYPLRGDIPDKLEIIKFPCLRFASPWPFDGQNGPDDREARRRETNPPLFTQFDGLLSRLRTQIPNPEARFNAYQSLAVDRVVNFARIHDLERRRLLALDRQHGCSIGRFIVDGFRTMRLFRTTGDPSALLYRMLLQLILDRLGVDRGYPEDDTPGGKEADEVPVHPMVAKALGMTWANEDATYQFHGKRVRWEDYIRSYIERFG